MKRNKRAVIVLMTAFVFLLIGGIVMRAVNNRDTEEKEKRMTPEELIEYFGFTEEETEGVDIEKFLERYKITKESLK